MELVRVGIEKLIYLVEMVLSLIGDVVTDLDVFAIIRMMSLFVKILEVHFYYLSGFSERNDLSWFISL